MRYFLFFTCLLATGCTGIRDNVTPVDNFDIERYLGAWYKIARPDHSFGRGLSQVSAEYSTRDDGGIR
jgi:apolipoprotein D and lipocalin family protein